MNRRDLLPSMMAGLAAASPVLSAAAATAGKLHGSTGISEFMMLDPVENFRQAMRLQRSLEDADDILHWYHFIMVAVPLNATPKPVVRWEGIEFSRHQIMSENRYRMHGHNLSFPRDLKTGKFVSEVQNPITGKIVPVPPMALTQDPGLIRSPAGVISLDKPSAPPRPDYKMLRRENGFVKVDGIRVPPDSWPVTFLEMGTEAAPAQIFDDSSVKWLPTEVSGAYVFPWPAWMQMGNTPGHMFAAWSGCKLRSIDELPTEFSRRAKKDFPQLLRVDRSAFERPLPDLHPG
ncbi:MAG: hypothetical protein RL321_705 [Pseudomonadota bacterium]|jgi:hypothetical protein